MADEKTTRKSDQPKVNTQSVEDAFAEANERGYFGQVTDETPNEAYTVAGVVKKAKTDGK